MQMKLQLNINGSFFHSEEIDDDEMMPISSYRIHERIPVNEHTIESHVVDLKMMFYKQILKAHNYEIILVIESKPNLKKYGYEQDRFRKAFESRI